MYYDRQKNNILIFAKFVRRMVCTKCRGKRRIGTRWWASWAGLAIQSARKWREYGQHEEVFVGSSIGSGSADHQRCARSGSSNRLLRWRTCGSSSSVSRTGIRMGRRLLVQRLLGARLLEFRGYWRPHLPRRHHRGPRAGLLPPRLRPAFRPGSFSQVAPPSAACTMRPLPTGEAALF